MSKVFLGENYDMILLLDREILTSEHKAVMILIRWPLRITLGR